LFRSLRFYQRSSTVILADYDLRSHRLQEVIVFYGIVSEDSYDVTRYKIYSSSTEIEVKEDFLEEIQ
jgi:hypothetical protein